MNFSAGGTLEMFLFSFLLLTRNDSKKASWLTNQVSDRTATVGLPVSLLLDKGNLPREQPAFMRKCVTPATPPLHTRCHGFVLDAGVFSCDL